MGHLARIAANRKDQKRNQVNALHMLRVYICTDLQYELITFPHYRILQ